MDQDSVEELLRHTLEDGKISRSERKVLKEFLRQEATEPHQRQWIRNRAIAIAKNQTLTPDGAKAVNWLEDVVGILFAEESSDEPAKIAEVHFSPGDACLARLRELIRSCRSSLDICVFTITDDRISRLIVDAHRKNVNVRIISDNDKSLDIGSDIRRLADQGVPTRLDQVSDHMHHKFALFDNQIAVSGSYNWTRSAADRNEENIVVSDDPRILSPFRNQFERLWKELG